MNEPPQDWTCDESGRSNSSDLYNTTVSEVARLISSGGPGMCLDRNWVHGTAGLIVAHLAHKHGFRPPAE